MTTAKDHDLLGQLGALADEQREAPLPPELQAPLGEAFESAVLARVLSPDVPSRSVLPLVRRPTWVRRGLKVALPVALAASLLLFIDRSSNAPLDPVPPYSLELSGAVSSDRSDGEANGATASAVELAPDTVLELVLRPGSEGRTPVTAVLFVVRGAQVERLDLAPQTSSGGAFRFEVPSHLLLPTSGSAELVAWVGAREDAEDSAQPSIPAEGQRFRRELRRR